MAAATVVVTVNDSAASVDALPAKTSMLGLIRGDAPITLGNGLKAAFVTITVSDTGTYTTAGWHVDMLDKLPGWTAVLGAVPAYFLDNATYHIASYNPVTDNVLLHVVTTGAERGTGAMTATNHCHMLVLGY